jgi:hypothetical protein
MNANKIKLSMSRNSKRAFVANLSVDDVEIFATSHGHLLACALHLIGAEALHTTESEFLLALDEQGKLFGYEFVGGAKECVFMGEMWGGLILANLKSGVNDSSYRLVRSLLPKQLVATFNGDDAECAEEPSKYFKKFIYYPYV